MASCRLRARSLALGGILVGRCAYQMTAAYYCWTHKLIQCCSPVGSHDPAWQGRDKTQFKRQGGTAITAKVSEVWQSKANPQCLA